MAKAGDTQNWNKRPVKTSDVEAALLRLSKIGARLGVKDQSEQWILVVGSRKHRKPWELHRVTPGGREVKVTFIPNGRLGESSTEALQALRAAYAAWRYVLNLQEGK